MYIIISVENSVRNKLRLLVVLTELSSAVTLDIVSGFGFGSLQAYGPLANS